MRKFFLNLLTLLALLLLIIALVAPSPLVLSASLVGLVGVASLFVLVSE